MAGRISYTVGRSLIIERVDGAWDEVDTEDPAADLTGARFVGRRLLRFIDGDVTRMWVSSVLAGVIASRRNRSLEYRCDGTRTRRYARMDLEYLGDGLVRSTHRTLGTETPGWTVSYSRSVPSSRALKRCSICNAVRIKGEWLDPFEIGKDIALGVFYGVCPPCMDRLRD